MPIGGSVRIGTAGWSIPRELQPHFLGEGTHLERYATRFDSVEINSTFHRPHRPSTYARWAASVPEDFRFSVKLPRTITHDLGLRDAGERVEAFLGDVAHLGARLGCLLVQLPPKLELDSGAAGSFFAHLRARFGGGVAVEPRHESWFESAADRMLAGSRICRVVADPTRSPAGLGPGGWAGLAYYRLHGSPRMYYSSYDEGALDRWGAALLASQDAGIPAWCIFDNTTLGAGTANALSLKRRFP